MKKILLIVLFTLLIIVGFTSCKEMTSIIFGGMDNLPKGEFLTAYKSPSGDYTVNT